MCIPDAVARQAAQVHPLAEPQGRGVDAGLVALRLDLLAEGDGALGAVLDAQTVGTAILAAGGLSIEVDGVVQLAAIQDVGAAHGFLPGLLFVDGLTEEVDAHLQARIAGVGEVLLEHGVQHQRTAAVAAVADADDDELDARRLYLFPVDAGLIFRDIDAEGGILLHAVGVEVVELVVDGLDALHGLVGVLVIIIGLAAHCAPAGIDRGRGAVAAVVFVAPAEKQVPQPAQQAVLVRETGGVDAALVQRACIQCGADLLRGQQDGALLGLHRQGSLLGVRLCACFGLGLCGLLHRCAQGVLCGQCLRLLL